MAYCDSCDTLKNLSATFWQNGVTTAVCNSLKNNTGLNANLSTPHTNCEDFEYMIDCMIGGITEQLDAYDACDIKDWIRMAMSNLYTLEKAYNCSLCGLWQRLEDLEEVVNSLLRQNYQDLVYGTDYTMRWFSDWYSNAGHVSVRAIETPATLAVRVIGSSGEGTRPRHDNLKSLELRHTSPISDRPRSRMFGIRFLGNYAKYNSIASGGRYDFVTYSSGGTGIWNAYNTAGFPFGGSHMGVVSLAQNYTDENNATWTMMGNAVSYADGYNLQFTTAAGYPDGCYLPSINMSIDATFIDKTTL